MILTQNQKRGAFATVVFHTALIIILLFFGIITPFPPLPEGGFTFDFGNSETGIGLEEPSAGQLYNKPLNKIKAEITPKIVTKTAPKSKTAVKNEENLLTQDQENTIALKTAEKKKADNEKKLKLENERILREEAEKQKRQKEAEAKQISAINARAENAFGAGGQTVNGSKSTGQGVTYGPGNQGSPDGIPGANQYGLGGGLGNGRGSGTSFNLSGRSAQSLPKPNFPGNEAGIVVVEVTVNKFGKVTEALPGVKGSNTINSDLLQAAKKAALAASFNSDANAPAFQKGTITYHFVLQ
jgi:colicin import membrane protein